MTRVLLSLKPYLCGTLQSDVNVCCNEPAEGAVEADTGAAAGGQEKEKAGKFKFDTTIKMRIDKIDIGYPVFFTWN